jgi:exosortase H (IPTLxxWG-CTERM-specific)
LSQSSTRGPDDGDGTPGSPQAGEPNPGDSDSRGSDPHDGQRPPGGGSPLALLRDPWFRFAATFGILAVTCEILYYAVLVDTEPLKVYLRALATGSAVLLDLVGVDVEHSGATVRHSGFAVQIAHGCDAIQICALLTCAMIAFPSPWKAKLTGLFFGILWLQFLNQLRIVSLLLIGAHYQSWFEDAHLVVWPTFLIVITVVTWIAWVRLASLDEPEPSGVEA